MDTQHDTDKVGLFARIPLLALGFRPFYLSAYLFALLALPIWLASFAGAVEVGGYLRGIAWHSHEMIFGFAPAVIAGFLLTAVRNWTGQPTPTGGPLAALVLLWLAARVLMLSGPGNVAALVDVLFLPALGVVIAIPIWRSRNTRNFKILAVVAALALANVSYHLAQSGMLPAGYATLAITTALNVIAVLIAIMGGRVIPSFIGNAVKHAEPRHSPVVEVVAIGSLLLVLVANIAERWVSLPQFAWIALLAVAAAAHIVRLLLWQPFSTRHNPLLWMLPVAYAWLPVTLLLRALAQGGVVATGAAVHAMTVGAIASLMVAMMMRSALGHSGRPLVAKPVEVVAFLLLQSAAIVRVLASIVAPGQYREAMMLSGVLWTLAFAAFLSRHWAILTQPRVDGRPG